MNAIALSLNRASRGLLLDPTNGLADLGRKELRALYSTAFYDDPLRLLRLVRLRLYFPYTVEERTQAQYQNARAAKVEQQIPTHALWDELRRIASEPNPSEVMQAFAQDGFLPLFSPALSGPELNLAGLAKLEKVRRLLPVLKAWAAAAPGFGPFLYALTEPLNSTEKAAMAKRLQMRKAEVDVWQKLPARSKKLETALRSAKLKKASQIYDVLSKAPVDEIVFLLSQSPLRLVQDRVRNYLQKYIPLSQEITDAEVEAKGVAPGTPKFQKLKAEMVAARLDGKTKRPPPPPVEPVALGPAGRGRGVRQLCRHPPTDWRRSGVACRDDSRRPLWGRLSTCGGLSTRLAFAACRYAGQDGGRLTNGPQVQPAPRVSAQFLGLRRSETLSRRSSRPGVTRWRGL